MSLEQNIQALTSAVNELVVVMKRAAPAAVAHPAEAAPAAEAPKQAPKTKKEVKPVTGPGEAAEHGLTATEAVEALRGHANTEQTDSDRAAAEFEAAAKVKEAAAKAEGTLTYEQVRDAVLTVSRTKGREKAVALLSRFGASGVSSVDKEHYPELFKLTQATLSGEVDPEAACEDLA